MYDFFIQEAEPFSGILDKTTKLPVIKYEPTIEMNPIVIDDYSIIGMSVTLVDEKPISAIKMVWYRVWGKV